MRLRATIFKFLLFSCLFCCFSGVARATELASVSYVDSRVEQANDKVIIKNTSSTPVTLSQNPQTTNIQTSSNKEVATIGWTDTNRTSKVRNGQNGTTLVDMWIE